MFKVTKIIFALMFASNCFAAQVYKWVDDQGQTHFSDTPPISGAQTDTVDIKINSYSSVSYDSSDAQQVDGVVMYSTSWCGYCKKAKAYFEQQNIAYTEYDIEKSPSAKLDYDRIGGTGVPVILVGDQRMNGFSVTGFNRIYKR